MRIAQLENGQIFQHFGHTEQFKLYDVENGEIRSSEVVNTNGAGHGALAGFLSAHHVDTLICGGIGGGAQNALAQAGIQLYGGVSGSADEAVQALLTGALSFDPNVHCNHHEHSEGPYLWQPWLWRTSLRKSLRTATRHPLSRVPCFLMEIPYNWTRAISLCGVAL